MDIKQLFDENEKPLDRLATDGGYAAIFRKIACVGDSLSSGEFETYEDGAVHYRDIFEYSWGQYMARMVGGTAYNFSRGGMTARWFLNNYAAENDFWNKEKAAQAYIIAMGCNDITKVVREGKVFGTIDDVKEDYHDNADTFAGNFARIVSKYKEISPDAKFFFVTMPHTKPDERDVYRDKHRELMYQFAEHFNNSYVIDLRQYAPFYDEDFTSKFYLAGHMNPAGYLLTAQMIISYIDYIVRHNLPDFKKVGLINTPYMY